MSDLAPPLRQAFRVGVVQLDDAHISALSEIVRQETVASTLFRHAPPPPFRCRAFSEPGRGLSEGERHFVAYLNHDRTLVGGGTVLESELSFYVRPDVWGCGIGGAIARALIEDARTGQVDRRLQIIAYRDNPASIRIAERLGFHFEGFHWSPSVTDRPMLRFVLRT